MDRHKGYIDLHLHTRFSDGERTLEETIVAAEKAGLSAIAVTDHNCFAIEAPIKRAQLEVIPGAEFSTTYHYGNGRKAELHIVGLFFEGVDPALNEIFTRFHKHAYIEAILKKLNSLGMSVTMDELRARNPDSKQYGRMQVADILVEKGYAADRADAMDRWIGNSSPHYIQSLDHIHYIETEECVRQICAHKGLPVLAHPFHYKFSNDEIEEMAARCRRVTDHPLAMEVYYGKYTDEQVRYLEGLADRYGLLPSTGSDSHRVDQEFVKGNALLLEAMREAMKAAAGHKPE